MNTTKGISHEKGFLRIYRFCLQKEVRGLLKSKASLWLLAGIFFPCILLLPPGLEFDKWLIHDSKLAISFIFVIGAVAGPVHYMWNSTTMDRLRRTSVLFFNLGISFWYSLLAKLTICLVLFLLYLTCSLIILAQYLTIPLVFMGLLGTLLYALFEYAVVMMVRDFNAILITIYGPLFLVAGVVLLFAWISDILLRGVFLLGIVALVCYCLATTMKGKRLRCNM